MAPERFKGQPVELGGTTFIVPPLALGKVQELEAKLRSVTLSAAGVPSLEHIDDMLDICLAAIRRNYPDVTREQLAELIDLGNIGTVVNAVMAVSGLVPRDGPEGNAAPGTATDS